MKSGHFKKNTLILAQSFKKEVSQIGASECICVSVHSVSMEGVEGYIGKPTEVLTDVII